jgi:HD-like signal output (HDOD) protein
MADRFNEVLDRMRKYRIPSHEAEKEILGTTHQEIGGVVAERWRIAEELREAIMHHHSPSESHTASELSAIICLGDAICGMYGIGSGIEATDGAIPQEAMEILKITDQELEGIAGEILTRTMNIKGSDAFSAF